MTGYELGLLTTTVTLNSNAAEIRAGADPMYIEEIGLFLEAATATKLGLGRPAVNGAGGTLNTGDGDLGGDDPASTGGVVLSGWTTTPTSPTTFKREVVLPGAIGNGIVWTWPDGLRVKQNTSLVLWNIAASSALRLYLRWHE